MFALYFMGDNYLGFYRTSNTPFTIPSQVLKLSISCCLYAICTYLHTYKQTICKHRATIIESQLCLYVYEVYKLKNVATEYAWCHIIVKGSSLVLTSVLILYRPTLCDIIDWLHINMDRYVYLICPWVILYALYTNFFFLSPEHCFGWNSIVYSCIMKIKAFSPNVFIF